MTRWILAAGVVLAACGGNKTPDDGAAPPAPPANSTGAQVHIETSAQSYAAGGNVAMTIHNGATSQVAFNPCTRAVERESSGVWTPVPEPSRVCTMEAWILEPDSSRGATTQLPADLTAGQYRLAIDFATQNQASERIRGTSNAFAVTK